MNYCHLDIVPRRPGRGVQRLRQRDDDNDRMIPQPMRGRRGGIRPERDPSPSHDRSKFDACAYRLSGGLPRQRSAHRGL